MKKQEKTQQIGFSGQHMQQLLRRARSCTLSTLSKEDGTPYGSLANMATDKSGHPILLLSKLAWHTQNLMADARASIMAAELPSEGDVLVGPRVTVLGHLEERSAPDFRERYLTLHPAAQLYADFPDFSFWVMVPRIVHAVAGFGRIQTLSSHEVFQPE